MLQNIAQAFLDIVQLLAVHIFEKVQDEDILFDWDEEDTPKESSESKEVKVPTYIPPQVKEEVKKEVVKTEQHEDSDKDDEEKIAEMIMAIREAKNDSTYGAEVVEMLQKGLLQSAEIDAIRVKIENTYFDLGLGA